MHSKVPAVDGFFRGVMLPSGMIVKNNQTVYEGSQMTVVYQVFISICMKFFMPLQPFQLLSPAPLLSYSFFDF